MLSRLASVAVLSAALLFGVLPSTTTACCSINSWEISKGAPTVLPTNNATASNTSSNVHAWQFYPNGNQGTNTGNPSVPGGFNSELFRKVQFPAFTTGNSPTCTACTNCDSTNQYLTWGSESTTNWFNVIVNGYYLSSSGTFKALPPGLVGDISQLLAAYSGSGAAYTTVWQQYLAGITDFGNIGTNESWSLANNVWTVPANFSSTLLTKDPLTGHSFNTSISQVGHSCYPYHGGCTTWSIKLPSFVWNCTQTAKNWAFINDANFYYGCAQPGYWLVDNNCPAPPTPGGKGDPQFAGLRGQDYQVHGIDGGIYNVISDKYMQLNSKFAFLTGPRPCPVMPSSGKKSVACFAHAGSYLGNLALKTANDDRVLIESGAADSGMTTVTFNGVEMSVGESKDMSINGRNGSITVLSTHEVLLNAGLFEMEVENSDGFLNLRSVIVRTANWKELKEEKAHGLLGQTWNLRKGKSAIEGKVDDYLIESEDLFGTDFMFNRFGEQ